MVGTTTSGSYVQLTVAGNSSAIFGAEIATVSTLFARYKINKLKVSVGYHPSSTNRYSGVRYVGENTAAPGVVTCLSLLDGTHSAASMAPSVRNAFISLNTRDLAASGLEWRECDDSAEALGVYGELTVVQELAGAIFLHFEWDISFADLASSGLHLLPPQAVHAMATRGPSALHRLMTGGPAPTSLPASQEEKDPRDFEVVSRSDTPRSVVSAALRGPFQSPAAGPKSRRV